MGVFLQGTSAFPFRDKHLSDHLLASALFLTPSFQKCLLSPWLLQKLLPFALPQVWALGDAPTPVHLRLTLPHLFWAPSSSGLHPGGGNTPTPKGRVAAIPSPYIFSLTLGGRDRAVADKQAYMGLFRAQ